MRWSFVALSMATACGSLGQLSDGGRQGPLEARWLGDAAVGGVRLVEASHQGPELALDVETASEASVYGLAYALRFDATCLMFERFEAPADVAAPVRLARGLAPGDVRGAATFRGPVASVAPGTHRWGRLHFRALTEGECAIGFVDDRSRLLQSRTESAAVAWAGGRVVASAAE